MCTSETPPGLQVASSFTAATIPAAITTPTRVLPSIVSATVHPRTAIPRATLAAPA